MIKTKIKQELFDGKNKDLNTPRIELIRDVKVSYPGEEHAITN